MMNEKELKLRKRMILLSIPFSILSFFDSTGIVIMFAIVFLLLATVIPIKLISPETAKELLKRS